MAHLKFKVTIALCALLLLLTGEAGANPVWRFSNPKPHGNNILDMDIQDGVVWQVGDRGQLYMSPDLDNWFPVETGITRSLRSIAFFNNKTFVSTEEGGMLSGNSQAGFSFMTLGTTDWLEGIAASASTLVTVGDNGAIYCSGDGNSWSRKGNFSTWLRSVAYGSGNFVAVGEDGFIAKSSDGQAWEKISSSINAHLNKVAFINDRFWVVGEGGAVFTNNFRLTFMPVNVGVTNTLFAVTGNTNEVVIAGDSTVLLGNLQTGSWVQQADADTSVLAPLWPYYSALWDGRLFLLGGRTGMKVEGYRTNIVDPIVWYCDSQPTRSWLWSATRAPDFYAACGAQGTIVTSLDGIDWTREVVPSSAASNVLLGIGGNTNALVAVGNAGTILRAPNLSTNIVRTNANGELVITNASLFGVIWEESHASTTNDLQAVAANNGTFVIGGGKGALFTSTDAKNWQPRVSGVTNFLSGAASYPQGWVVSGAGGTILTSSDAATWRTRSTGTTQWIYSVRYVGQKLIAVGENGLILTSDDGQQWTSRQSGTTEWLNDVTFAQNTWYIAGSVGLVLTSTDAVNWGVTRSSTSKSLYSAVTDGEQLVMAGLEGVILHSQLVPISTPVNFLDFNLAAGDNYFLFNGVVDQRFVLEEANQPNEGWRKVANLEILGSGGTVIYERANDGSPRKLFRTRLLTP